MKDISIINTAKETIQIEIVALQRLLDTFDESFVAIVRLIYSSKGRLVVTGIGKSALVGKKIVATLNSTGTPSIFMHAADAIHGDLGMITPEDIVLCISKSGETSEIKVLIPLVKYLGSAVIGMTSQPQSTLGKQADYVLHTPIEQEADPNNLAPTASTTTQMALGDALATALLAFRGFSAQDFAKFHPGGSLGKQLYLKVTDLYTKNDCPSVFPQASIQEVILEMTSKRLGATVVVNKNQEVLGMITDGDLRRMLTKTTDFQTLNAESIMTTAPKTIPKNELAVKALEVMRMYSISQLVVTDGNIYQGIIHLHDLIREGIV